VNAYDGKLNGYSYPELVEGSGPMKPGNLNKIEMQDLLKRCPTWDRGFPWLIRVKGAKKSSFPH